MKNFTRERLSNPENTPKNRGLFIVIEGIGGSGKTTQLNLLTSRLVADGHQSQILSFPRYGEESSLFARKYLAGDCGPVNEVKPEIASIFFALDRYFAIDEMNQILDRGETIVVGRFVASNLVYHGVKIKEDEKRRTFFRWIDDLEYNLFGIPRPDLNLILDIPAGLSFDLIEKRNQTDSTNPKDIHEQSVDHQRQNRKVYQEICRIFPNQYILLDCVDQSGNLLSKQAINDLIWQTVESRLD